MNTLVNSDDKCQVQRRFAEFYGRQFFNILERGFVDEDARLALLTVCKRPEFRPLLRGIRFVIDELNDLPFFVNKEREIILDNTMLETPALAAFHLRHALEIVTIRTCLPDNGVSSPLAVAIAAYHTALSYLAGMIRQEQDVVWEKIPEWMSSAAVEVCSRNGSSGDARLFDFLVEKNAFLLRLQEQEGAASIENTTSDVEAAIHLAKRLLGLAHPCERLLATQGDTRLHVDRDTGLNTYGCSPRPRPWAITFSSCTASSVSDVAYQEAEWLRQELLGDAWKGRLIERCKQELQRIRSNIASILRLDDDGVKVMLTPSGTDCELYAAYFAIGADRSEICNIVISSTEIGSGTIHAAAGRHFDEVSPLGGVVEPGVSLEAFPSDLIEVSMLELRDEDGSQREAEELDAAARSLVEKALSQGKRVLVHLLDCSKTGIGAPSMGMVRQLREQNPESVFVVVDAAQMRIGREALKRYLDAGFMVLITGSKFFTGAPFAGGMLVPSMVAERIPDLPPLPEGFSAYSARMDLPQEWSQLLGTLRQEPNIGLLLRWQTALWEMRAFFSVDGEKRYNTIDDFGKNILQMIGQNPDLELVMAPPHDREHRDGELCWDQLPSIFTFMIYHHDPEAGRRPLTYEEARCAYRCINMDIARFLPLHASDRENELARKRCHIGQPVRISNDSGRWIGALRIAAGARLVSGVEFDDGLGDTSAERLNTEIRTAGVIFNKLSVIVKYWDSLAGYDLYSGATPNANFYLF